MFGHDLHALGKPFGPPAGSQRTFSRFYAAAH